MLKTSSLSIGYGRRPVLRDVDLEVRRGEFWFLVGPNGEGKTTLLRVILGEMAPQAGRLRLHPELESRERIGFVPQTCSFRPTLPTTVREYVLLGLVSRRTRRKERVERLSWALEKVGLSGLETESLWSLSGGQRQRALVARALVRRPTFLIADEPMAGLDFPGNEALARCLGDLNRRDGLTILLVTHDLSTAVRYGTHFALCGGGRIIAGTGERVLTPENLKRIYEFPVVVSREGSGPPTVSIENSAGGS